MGTAYLRESTSGVLVLIHAIYILIYSIAIPVMRVLALLGNKKFKALFEIHNSSSNPPLPKSKYAWFHCASFGEYEQAAPVIEAYIEAHPSTPILLTLFSPSGYIPLRDKPPSWLRPGDHITALPLDTPRRVATFLSSFNSQAKFFAASKYDIWPTLIRSLNKKSIPTYVFAAHITEDSQVVRSSYLKWVWAQLLGIYTQGQDSTNTLSKSGLSSTPLGDPRVDRVLNLASSSAPPAGLTEWKADSHLTVAGSTWRQEEVILATLPWSSTNKLIVAPHDISPPNIQRVLNLFNATSTTASLLSDDNFSTPVIIVDSMGQLTSIYPLADLAIVGGGFGNGIHNILEPAANGINVVTGPNVERFREASILLSEGVLTVVPEANRFASVVWDSISKPKPQSTWLNSQKGSAIKIASTLP